MHARGAARSTPCSRPAPPRPHSIWHNTLCRDRPSPGSPRTRPSSTGPGSRSTHTARRCRRTLHTHVGAGKRGVSTNTSLGGPLRALVTRYRRTTSGPLHLPPLAVLCVFVCSVRFCSVLFCCVLFCSFPLCAVMFCLGSLQRVDGSSPVSGCNEWVGGCSERVVTHR
jgi:hypothetical protein